LLAKNGTTYLYAYICITLSIDIFYLLFESRFGN